MRKQLKQKLKSCKWCNPHKMHWANRWNAKDRASMKATDEEQIQYALCPCGKIIGIECNIEYNNWDACKKSKTA